jgi:hypothetical protein
VNILCPVHVKGFQDPVPTPSRSQLAATHQTTTTAGTTSGSSTAPTPSRPIPGLNATPGMDLSVSVALDWAEAHRFARDKLYNGNMQKEASMKVQDELRNSVKVFVDFEV